MGKLVDKSTQSVVYHNVTLSTLTRFLTNSIVVCETESKWLHESVLVYEAEPTERTFGRSVTTAYGYTGSSKTLILFDHLEYSESRL